MMKSIGDKLIDPAVERIRKLPFKHMLILLLCTDLFFISLHILRSLPGIDLISALEDSAFSISHDLGLGEAFQYIKELWIASLLGVLAFRYGKKTYLGWSVLFGYLLLDDMLGFHESFGRLGGSAFDLPIIAQVFPHLRMEDIAELGSSAILGLFFLGLLFVLYRKSTAEIRLNQNIIFVLFAALIGFGVVLDFFDRFAVSRLLAELLKLAEDGGEMLVMSSLCWFVFALFEEQSGQHAFEGKIARSSERSP